MQAKLSARPGVDEGAASVVAIGWANELWSLGGEGIRAVMADSDKATGGSKPSRAEKTAAIVLIVALMAPNVIWISNDHSVWPWDQANYGDWTLRTWRAHLLESVGWSSAMIHALGANPPLIAWAGQFFLPLRHLTGGFERTRTPSTSGRGIFPTCVGV